MHSYNTFPLLRPSANRAEFERVSLVTELATRYKGVRCLKLCNLPESANTDNACAAVARNLKNNSNWEAVDVSRCGAGGMTLKKLEASLPYNHTLKFLDLSFNPLPLEFIGAFCGALTRNHALETLLMKKTGLDDSAAAFVGDMLEENSSLRHLNISCNSITDKGATSLLKSLESNISLLKLEVSRNQFSCDETYATLSCCGVRNLKIYTKKLDDITRTINTLKVASWQRPRVVLLGNDEAQRNELMKKCLSIESHPTYKSRTTIARVSSYKDPNNKNCFWVKEEDKFSEAAWLAVNSFNLLGKDVALRSEAEKLVYNTRNIRDRNASSNSEFSIHFEKSSRAEGSVVDTLPDESEPDEEDFDFNPGESFDNQEEIGFEHILAAERFQRLKGIELEFVNWGFSSGSNYDRLLVNQRTQIILFVFDLSKCVKRRSGTEFTISSTEFEKAFTNFRLAEKVEEIKRCGGTPKVVFIGTNANKVTKSEGKRYIVHSADCLDPGAVIVRSNSIRTDGSNTLRSNTRTQPRPGPRRSRKKQSGIGGSFLPGFINNTKRSHDPAKRNSVRKSETKTSVRTTGTGLGSLLLEQQRSFRQKETNVSKRTILKSIDKALDECIVKATRASGSTLESFNYTDVHVFTDSYDEKLLFLPVDQDDSSAQILLDTTHSLLDMSKFLPNNFPTIPLSYVFFYDLFRGRVRAHAEKRKKLLTPDGLLDSGCLSLKEIRQICRKCNFSGRKIMDMLLYLNKCGLTWMHGELENLKKFLVVDQMAFVNTVATITVRRNMHYLSKNQKKLVKKSHIKGDFDLYLNTGFASEDLMEFICGKASAEYFTNFLNLTYTQNEFEFEINKRAAKFYVFPSLLNSSREEEISADLEKMIYFDVNLSSRDTLPIYLTHRIIAIAFKSCSADEEVAKLLSSDGHQDDTEIISSFLSNRYMKAFFENSQVLWESRNHGSSLRVYVEDPNIAHEILSETVSVLRWVVLDCKKSFGCNLDYEIAFDDGTSYAEALENRTPPWFVQKSKIERNSIYVSAMNVSGI